LRTGDVGRFDEDGYLYLLDRKNDMIITGGFNVYSKEVETALDDHPAVAQSCVIGVLMRSGGSRDRRRRPRGGGRGRRDHRFREGPEGQRLRPKSIEVVDELPQTSLGKVDKSALRARFWSDRDRAVN